MIRGSDVRVALAARDQLGEGPHWDAARQELLRVDIGQGLLHRWQPDTGASSVDGYHGELSAVVPRRGGGLVAAVGHEILLVGPNGSREVIAAVERDRPDNRFNDCRCDPQGRLWAGTMSKVREPGNAALYRLTPGEEIEQVVPRTTLSNGMGWSPEGELMYFVDSTTQRIDVFDFDGGDGSVHDRRCFAAIDPADGLPDGITVDAEGGVWVCLFGGGAVRRYAEGRLDATIALPVSNPTCPVFGGANLRTLFVTTARHRLSDSQLQGEPVAGSVLVIEPGVGGLPGNCFAG
jgi:sugar lactone lactonase YvrE